MRLGILLTFSIATICVFTMTMVFAQTTPNPVMSPADFKSQVSAAYTKQKEQISTQAQQEISSATAANTLIQNPSNTNTTLPKPAPTSLSNAPTSSSNAMYFGDSTNPSSTQAPTPSDRGYSSSTSAPQTNQPASSTYTGFGTGSSAPSSPAPAGGSAPASGGWNINY